MCNILIIIVGKSRNERHGRGRNELKNAQSLESDRPTLDDLGFISSLLRRLVFLGLTYKVKIVHGLE